MQEIEGADDYDGSVIDVDALEAAEAEAKQQEGAETEEADIEVEAESPPAVEDNDEEKTDDAQKESEGFQERIDKLTKNWRETERALSTLEHENAELRRQVETIGSQTKQETVKTLADFDYDEKAYREYVVEDTRRIAAEEAAKVARGFGDRRQEDQRKTEYQEREEAFAKDNPDFIEKVYDKSLKISEPMAQVIREVDVGPDVAYYLANNPEEAAQIFRQSPVAAGMEMAAIVTKIRDAKATASKQKEVSTAPPPPGKLPGKEASLRNISTTDPKSDKMSDDEWFKREELRLAKLRG